MIVPVNSEWRIRSDELQWVLERHHPPKVGEPGEGRWRAKGYYSSLDAVVIACARARLRLLPDSADALITICETMDRIEAECLGALREAKTHKVPVGDGSDPAKSS